MSSRPDPASPSVASAAASVPATGVSASATGHVPAGAVRQLYVASGEGGIYSVALEGQQLSGGGPVVASSDAPATGVAQLQQASAGQKPFFLMRHPLLPVLYAIDIGAATIGTYAIRADGGLTQLGLLGSGDSAPCHLAVDPRGRFIVVAHYKGGASLYLLDAQGVPQDASASVSFTGSGPNADRQSGPHPHGVMLDPDGNWAYIADLGTDSVHVLHVGAAAGTLAAVDDHRIALEPADGPRHCVLSPDGRLAAVVNELSNTVALFGISGGTEAGPGDWRLLARRSTLPSDWQGTSHTAEIAFSAAGDALYATNRGHDSVAAFAVGGGAGTASGEVLSEATLFATAGKWPQHLLADPLLAVAHTNSDSVSIFAGAPKGMAPTEVLRVAVAKPLCLAIN